MFALANEKSRI